MNRNSKSFRGGLFRTKRSPTLDEKIARLERKILPATRRSPLRFFKEKGYFGSSRKEAAENKRIQWANELAELKKQSSFHHGANDIMSGLGHIQNKNYDEGLYAVNAGVNAVDGYVDGEYKNAENVFNKNCDELTQNVDAANNAFEGFNSLGGNVDQSEVDKVLSKAKDEVDAAKVLRNMPSSGNKQISRGTRRPRA